MKKKIIGLFILFVIGVSNVFSAPFSLNSGAKKVLASIKLDKKTEIITQGDLDSKLAELKSKGDTSTTSDEVLEILINDKVFLMSAEKDKVFVTDDEVDERLMSLKAELEKQYSTKISDDVFYQQIEAQLGGMKLSEYKNALKESLLVDKYLRAKKSSELDVDIALTDDEIKGFYRKNESSFVNPEYVRVSHIYIPKTETGAKEKLDSVLEKIKKGEISFEKAVVEYSLDDASKTQGGNIGNVTSTNSNILGEDFISTVLDLDVGEVADKVVESPSGFHIVKSMFHGAKKFLSLDDYISPDSSTTVREYIREYLQNQKSQENYVKVTNDLVDELRQAAVINYPDKNKRS